MHGGNCPGCQDYIRGDEKSHDAGEYGEADGMKCIIKGIPYDVKNIGDENGSRSCTAHISRSEK